MNSNRILRPITAPAFTLVELLVVITIVVVLLSLLTPALDTAVYQAELATCAAKLDAIGGSMTSGAVQYQRRYPDRPTRYMAPTVNVSGRGDDRPALRRYLGENLNAMLNDPLTKPIDINGAATTSLINTSYAMWYGFLTGPNQQIMHKLGDRWTWSGGADGLPNTADDVRYHFNIMAQDFEFRNATYNIHLSSHSDRDNVMYHAAPENPTGETRSLWLVGGNQTWGLVDFNVLYQDGSVVRIADMKPKGQVMGVDNDERMITVPYFYNFNKADQADVGWIRVPKQQ